MPELGPAGVVRLVGLRLDRSRRASSPSMSGHAACRGATFPGRRHLCARARSATDRPAKMHFSHQPASRGAPTFGPPPPSAYPVHTIYRLEGRSSRTLANSPTAHSYMICMLCTALSRIEIRKRYEGWGSANSPGGSGPSLHGHNLHSIPACRCAGRCARRTYCSIRWARAGG